jgi:hypothetical protein
MGKLPNLAGVLVSIGVVIPSAAGPLPRVTGPDVLLRAAQQGAWQSVPFTLHRDHVVLVKASVGRLRDLVFVPTSWAWTCSGRPACASTSGHRHSRSARAGAS